MTTFNRHQRKESDMEEHTSELQNHKHLEDLEYFSLQLIALKDTLDMISAAFQQQKIGNELFCTFHFNHSYNFFNISIFYSYAL